MKYKQKLMGANKNMGVFVNTSDDAFLSKKEMKSVAAGILLRRTRHFKMSNLGMPSTYFELIYIVLGK